jgi:hypothetical protein
VTQPQFPERAAVGFSPTWRYNPVKRQLQIWISPVQCLAFGADVLAALTAQGWRNCHHEALIKLPISTR